MTKTESQFRTWANKEFPDGFIVKLPDFKTGAKGMGGLPDYLVINDSHIIWFEVKKIPGNTINLKNHFTPAQKIIFDKMLKSGAIILVYCFTKSKGRQLIYYSDIRNLGSIKF
jgi:hypothetical protein